MTVFEISIHALLAESDLRASAHLHTLRNFYPRSPCGERPEADAPKTPKQGFLSTLSLRRATRLFAKQYHAQGISIHALLAESDCYSLRHSAQGRYFYPRSPCGERLDWYLMILEKKDFYPRSPCGERPPRLSRVVPTPIFLSTLSLRRATNNINSSVNTADQISIHALLAESDSFRPSD